MPLSQSWRKSGRLFPIYYHKSKTAGQKAYQFRNWKMSDFVLGTIFDCGLFMNNFIASCITPHDDKGVEQVPGSTVI